MLSSKDITLAFEARDWRFESFRVHQYFKEIERQLDGLGYTESMQDKEENITQVKQNITKILDSELPICVDNFVRNNCEFAGFNLGDIYITKPDEDYIAMDSISLFLVNEENARMFSLICKAYRDDEKRVQLLELIAPKK